MIFPQISTIKVGTASLAFAALFFASATFAQNRIAQTLTAFLVRETPAFEIELHNIEFNPGHPTTNETLFQATSVNSHVAEQLLQEAVDTLKTYPTMHITVKGFTDMQECSKSVRDSLSLRRATLVYDWLLQHGVPSSQLKGPTGYGSASPIDDNSDAGRQRNRRVELELGL